MKIVLSIIISFVTTQAIAVPDLEFTIDRIQSIRDIYQEIDDNPTLVSAFLERSEQGFKAWSSAQRSFATLAKLLSQGPSKPSAQDTIELKESMEWALSERRVDLYVLLLVHDRLSNQNAKDGFDQNILYNEALQKAEALGAKWALYKILLLKANYLLGVNRMNQSMEAFEAAEKALKGLDNKQIYEQMLWNNEMAVFFEANDKPDKALQLYEKIEQQCQTRMLLDFCAKNLFNMGAIFANRDDVIQADRAIPLFEASIKLASKAGLERRMGMGTLGLATSNVKLKKFNAAERSALEAIALFTKVDDPLWLADSWKKLGTIRFEMKKFDEALSAFHEARNAFPTEQLADFVELDWLESKVFETLGRYKESHQKLKSYIKGQKTLASRRDDNAYFQKMVELGLATEEAKNQDLKTQIDKINMQNQKYSGFNLWVGLGVGILLGSGLSHIFRRKQIMYHLKNVREDSESPLAPREANELALLLDQSDQREGTNQDASKDATPR